MALLRLIKYWVLYPYSQYKERQRIKKRIKQLQERDPYIYK